MEQVLTYLPTYLPCPVKRGRRASASAGNNGHGREVNALAVAGSVAAARELAAAKRGHDEQLHVGEEHTQRRCGQRCLCRAAAAAAFATRFGRRPSERRCCSSSSAAASTKFDFSWFTHHFHCGHRYLPCSLGRRCDTTPLKTECHFHRRVIQSDKTT